jgi:hypothetical protein
MGDDRLPVGGSRPRGAKERPRGWWLVGGLLVLVLAAAVLVLEVWEHPPGWLRGPRGLIVAGLSSLRGRLLTAAGLGVVAGFAGVAAPLLVFWLQRHREDQRDRQDREQRSAETAAQRVRLMQAHCQFDEASGSLPRVSTLTNPVALGVHPATPVAELDVEPAARPTREDLPARVPVYVPRDLDAKLDDALEHDRLVLLRGDSTAGKSRAAYEAMRRLPGDRFVLIPNEQGSLRALRDAGFTFRDTVVWLNDLDRFLGPGGLDKGVLHWLVGDGSRRVEVLATMRASEYNRRTPASDHAPMGGERDLLRADRELLDQAVAELELERRFTPDEQARASASAIRGSHARCVARACSSGAG